MAEIIKFPGINRQSMKLDEALLFSAKECNLANRYPQRDIDRAIAEVVAVAERSWIWREEVVVRLSEEVKFSEEQMREINRAFAAFGEELRSKCFLRVAGERLLLELKWHPGATS